MEREENKLFKFATKELSQDAFIYGYAISNEMKEETEKYFGKKEE